MINIGGELKERACDSLVMCIVTTLNQGLRNGGGIGDILRAPSSIVSKRKRNYKNNYINYFIFKNFIIFQEPLFVARVVYDLLFFFIVIIIVLNLIFGVIIDTFADLRSEKQNKELVLKNTCFICGKYLFYVLFALYFLFIFLFLYTIGYILQFYICIFL